MLTRWIGKNDLTLGQLLDEIRDLYLETFFTAIESCGSDGSARVVAEVALSTADGEAIGEGPLGLPLRIDIAIVEDREVKETYRVDSERSLSFEPWSFEWRERLQVTLFPFQWDWCEAKIYGLCGSPDWKPLVDWFMSSFHQSSPSETAEDFSGVVHFMSDPESQGDCHMVSFDFGSAPVETFQSLLDAFAGVGAKSVEIGQF